MAAVGESAVPRGPEKKKKGFRWKNRNKTVKNNKTSKVSIDMVKKAEIQAPAAPIAAGGKLTKMQKKLLQAEKKRAQKAGKPMPSKNPAKTEAKRAAQMTVPEAKFHVSAKRPIVYGEIKLPGLTDPEKMDLEVFDDQVILEVEGFKPLMVQIDDPDVKALDQAKTKANLRNGILRLEIPVITPDEGNDDEGDGEEEDETKPDTAENVEEEKENGKFMTVEAEMQAEESAAKKKKKTKTVTVVKRRKKKFADNITSQMDIIASVAGDVEKQSNAMLLKSQKKEARISEAEEKKADKKIKTVIKKTQVKKVNVEKKMDAQLLAQGQKLLSKIRSGEKKQLF